MRSRPDFRAAPFLWGAAVCAAAFVVVYVVFVRSYVGQVIDERAFDGANAWSGSVEIAHDLLDILPAVAVVVASVLAIVLVAVRRNWRVLIVALAAAALALISNQMLKYSILDRPDTGVTDGLSNSFPSGHTSLAATAALVVFLLAGPRLRPVAAVLGSLFAVAAGASTLVEQWHRTSDVIASLLLVAFWGCLAGAVLVWMRMPGAQHPVTTRLWPITWIAAACALIAAVALVATYTSAQAGTSHLFVAYVGGVAAIVAVGLALAVLANRLFRALG